MRWHFQIGTGPCLSGRTSGPSLEFLNLELIYIPFVNCAKHVMPDRETGDERE